MMVPLSHLPSLSPHPTPSQPLPDLSIESLVPALFHLVMRMKARIENERTRDSARKSDNPVIESLPACLPASLLLSFPVAPAPPPPTRSLFVLTSRPPTTHCQYATRLASTRAGHPSELSYILQLYSPVLVVAVFHICLYKMEGIHTSTNIRVFIVIPF